MYHDISELAERPTSNLEERETNSFQILDSLFRFVSRLHRLKQHLDQISKYLPPLKIRRGWANVLSQNEGRTRWSSKSISKPQCIESDWCRKSRPNPALLTPAVKLRGGVGENV